MTGGSIRVLLADDHPAVRVGIRIALEAQEDFVLVGEATNGDEASRMACELTPDVLLLDLTMPGQPAGETMALLRQRCPDVRVQILTAYDDDAYVRGMVAAGAAVFVLKNEALEAVIRAVRSVASGDSWFSRAVVAKLAKPSAGRSAGGGEPSLAQRDIQILELMGRGWDNARIATELALNEQTVRNYATRIYANLGVSTRAEAIVWARVHGLNIADDETDEADESDGAE